MRRLLALALFIAAFAAAAAEPWERFFSPFLGDLRAEAEDARKAGKQGLVVMYQFQECPYCAQMKREVLSRPEVQEAYRKRFTAIEIDTRGAQPVTGFDGRTLPEKEFARAQGIRGTPTFVFYALDGTILATSVGTASAPEFILRGDRALGMARSRANP
ncbi:MAG TPA: thioredoxin family protein [Burkholderiales bacterium]|jgi:thioredoxin-related protein|nr:thioredoxin family protein [Burkholderiales bacterium]